MYSDIIRHEVKDLESTDLVCLDSDIIKLENKHLSDRQADKDRIEALEKGMQITIEYLETGKDSITGAILLNAILNPAKITEQDIKWANKIIKKRMNQ